MLAHARWREDASCGSRRTFTMPWAAMDSADNAEQATSVAGACTKACESLHYLPGVESRDSLGIGAVQVRSASRGR